MLAAIAAATVVAIAPTGFVTNAKLSERASWVAEKPVTVYCAETQADWQAFVTASGDAMSDPHGVTITVGASETYIDADGCATLFKRMSKQPVSLPILGAVLDVLTHESIHMRGEADEGQTECAAIRALPAFLVAKWGFRKNSLAYQKVMSGALSYHKRLPPQYRTVC